MKHKINTTYRIQKFLISALLLLAVSELYAAGTPAGTVIQSRTRVTFTTASGATVDTVYSTYVSITVAQIGSVNITPSTSSISTTSDSTNADYPVTVTNSGNGLDVLRLSALSKKGFVVQLFFDANGDGTLQAGEVSAGTISQTSSLAADAQYKLVARVKVPRNEVLNGQIDSTTITVKSNFDSTKTNSGVYTTTIQTAVLNGSMTVNNSIPNVGDQITYTLPITNSGSVTASNVILTDFLNNGFTIVSGTTTQGTFNGGTNPASWNIGSIPSNTTVTVTITLLVNSNNTSNAVLNNPMTSTYTVGSNNYSKVFTSPTVIVGGAYGVQIVPHYTTLTKEPTDTAVYRFKVRNSGSIKDVIEIQSSTTHSWTWQFYRDANNNLALDATDPLLTNTNGNATIDIDSVAAGDSVRVFAKYIVLRTKTDTVINSLNITVISSGDNSKQSSTSTATTVNEPIVDVQIGPLGNQPAGGVVTYTISYSNLGSVSVSNFSVLDTTPDSTVYIPNSLKLNGTAIQDNTGPLSVTNAPNGNRIIAVSIGTLSAQTTGSVEFQVKIK